jgi:hypothetical protein
MNAYKLKKGSGRIKMTTQNDVRGNVGFFRAALHYVDHLVGVVSGELDLSNKKCVLRKLYGCYSVTNPRLLERAYQRLEGKVLR